MALSARASRWRTLLPAGLAALVLCCLVALVLAGLDQLSYSDDEGVFVYTARALVSGEQLYDRVWYNYLPGFLRLLQGLEGLPSSIVASRGAWHPLLDHQVIPYWVDGHDNGS